MEPKLLFVNRSYFVFKWCGYNYVLTMSASKQVTKCLKYLEKLHFLDKIISVFAIINLYVIGKFYFQEKFSSL